MTTAHLMNQEQKIYKDSFAANSVMTAIQIALFISFYALFYGPIMYFLIRKIKLHGLPEFSDKLVMIIILSVAGLLPILYFVMSLAARIKYGMYRKIITDENGITFFGTFSRQYIKWEEILSLGIHDRLLLHILKITAGKIKMAELQIKTRKYFFPLSMVEKGQEYPMYCRGDLIDQNGNKVKEIRPEDCPLYMEIQKHLKNA